MTAVILFHLESSFVERFQKPRLKIPITTAYVDQTMSTV